MFQKKGKVSFVLPRLLKTPALLLLTLLFSQTIFAVALDPTFGSGGRITIEVTGTNGGSAGREVFIQPSGRILATVDLTCAGTPAFMGGFAYVGTDQNGALDPAFGTNGKITVCPGSLGYVLTDTEMLPDGSFISVGYVSFFKSSDLTPFITRRLENGSVDASFNADIRISSSVRPIRVSRLPDGKTLVVVLTNPTYYLIRLNSDGSRDVGFGDKGVKPVPLDRIPNGEIADMKTSSGGKILILFQDGTLARYNGDGELDRSFGLQGVYEPFFNSV